MEEEIKNKLYHLEQELLQLEFFKPPTEENLLRKEAILTEMQPLYKQLGGIFISKMNLNYRG